MVPTLYDMGLNLNCTKCDVYSTYADASRLKVLSALPSWSESEPLTYFF